MCAAATIARTAEMLQKKTQQGGYKEAADRLMDMEGLPRKQ
jgi:hypothetical protein